MKQKTKQKNENEKKKIKEKKLGSGRIYRRHERGHDYRTS